MPTMSERWRRALWFLMLWGGGVAALLGISWLIRLGMGL